MIKNKYSVGFIAQTLERLKMLDKKVPKHYKSYGICHILSINQSHQILETDVENFVGEEAKDWKNFSGSIKYPIPAPSTVDDVNDRGKELEAEEIFYRTSNMWIGKYGKLRKELVKFLIVKFENYLKEHT